jgi:hypothetical protein
MYHVCVNLDDLNIAMIALKEYNANNVNIYCGDNCEKYHIMNYVMNCKKQGKLA